MNLRTEIREDLWAEIEKSYESGSYKNAILNGFSFLSSVLRDRADVDGDGVSLVGLALGGDKPKLRINKFQTQSERDEQKGLEQTLRGLYVGFRNPRSHERGEDTKDAADAILLFLSYVIGIIGEAKPPFSIEEWCEMVLEKNFVPTQRYVDLLVQKVPSMRLGDVLISLYRKILERQSRNTDLTDLRMVFQTLIKALGDQVAEAYIEAVSEVLLTTQEDEKILVTLQILPPPIWRELNEASRIRIENKLINEIKVGEYNPWNDHCYKGALGTWASDFVSYFDHKDYLFITLLLKLQIGFSEANYVARFFIKQLPETVSADPPYHDRRVTEYISALATKSFTLFESSTYIRAQLSNLPQTWIDKIETHARSMERLDRQAFEDYFNKEGDIPF